MDESRYGASAAAARASPLSFNSDFDGSGDRADNWTEEEGESDGGADISDTERAAILAELLAADGDESSSEEEGATRAARAGAAARARFDSDFDSPALRPAIAAAAPPAPRARFNSDFDSPALRPAVATAPFALDGRGAERLSDFDSESEGAGDSAASL